jgi:hypothetical protein
MSHIPRLFCALAVVDNDCVWVDDTVVVWYREQLPAVDQPTVIPIPR